MSCSRETLNTLGAIALAAAALILVSGRANAATCLKSPVYAAAIAADEPLAAYKARANWDAHVSGQLGPHWSQWGAAEGAMVVCEKSARGGHSCLAAGRPCQFLGR